MTVLLNLFIILIISFARKTFSESLQEFKSLPTTVKAPENNTVLLPCYLEINGKYGMHEKKASSPVNYVLNNSF